MTTPSVSAYSTTPANNVQSNTGINWDEGMAPAAVNNSARQNMADLRSYANNPEWFFYGSGTSPVVTPVYVSSTSFKIAGIDVTAAYHVGRRIKAAGSGTGTIYGTISATAFSTDTTVTVGWDSGSLSNETLTISIGPAIANFPVSSQRLSTRQVLTSGSAATYTTPAGARQLKIRMVGGGGGGGGYNNSGNGGAGGDTTFNSIVAKGGTGGTQGSGTSTTGDGGAGGTGGAGSASIRRAGQTGTSGLLSVSTAQMGSGAPGGNSLLGAGSTTVSGPAQANSGGGGAGGPSSSTTIGGGGGGGAGEYVEFIINSPAATYTYTIGAGGTSAAGSAGGSGVIVVEEIY